MNKILLLAALFILFSCSKEKTSEESNTIIGTWNVYSSISIKTRTGMISGIYVQKDTTLFPAGNNVEFRNDGSMVLKLDGNGSDIVDEYEFDGGSILYWRGNKKDVTEFTESKLRFEGETKMELAQDSSITIKEIIELRR